MFRATTLFIVGIWAAAPFADAALGESKAQLQARYGRPGESFRIAGEDALEYRYKTFFVIVSFVGGKSAMETFVLQDGKTPLVAQEIEAFLNISFGSKRWHKAADIPLWTLGGRDRNSWTAIAAYYPKSPQMMSPALGVMTTTYAKTHGYWPKI